MDLVSNIDTATINNQYKVIFENSPLGILHYTIDGVLIECNQKFADIIGVKKEKLIGLNLFNSVKNSVVLENFKKALQQDTLFCEGNYVSVISGKTLVLRVNFNRISDVNAKVTGAVAMVEDLVPKIKSERELRILSEVAEKSPVSIVITDENNKILYVNRFFSIVSGYRFDEVVGRDPSFMGSESNTREIYDDLWESLNTTGNWEGILVNNKKDGDLYFEKAKIVCVRDIEGEITNYIAFKEDISLNIASEEKLKISENNFRNVLDNAGEMIMVISGGSLIYVNKELLKRSGYSRKEFQVKHFLSFVHPDDIPLLRKNYLSRIAGKAVESNYSLRAITKYGDIRNVELNVNETVFNGTPSLIVVMRDITDKLIMERELVDARNKAVESEKLKTTFLTTMSHELRTPLNHVIGFSNLLEDENINNSAKAYSRMIYKSSIRLLSIIEDVFTYIGLENGEVSFYKHTVTLFDLFTRNKSNLQKLLYSSDKSDIIKLKFRPDPQFFDLSLNVDIDKVNIILNHLFKNAVKFTVSGFIEFGYIVSADNDLAFYVKDTGIGIPEGRRGIIFDFFRQAEEVSTRNYGGIGLGLSLSKKMAESLNGEISFSSNNSNMGTTFYFKLPIDTEF